MAISYVGAGTTATGATSRTAVYPANILAGHFLLWVDVNKYPPNAPVFPPDGWTLISQYSGGAGAAGADSGNCYVTAAYKIADGTETGNLPVISNPSGNTGVSKVFNLSNATGYWSIASSVGSRNAGGDVNWTATTSGGIDIQNNDLVIVMSAMNTNTPTWTVFPATPISQSGTTFGAAIYRATTGTGTGDDIKMNVSSHPVTAGGGSGVVTVNQVASASPNASSPAGPMIVMRIREEPIPVPASPTQDSLILIHHVMGIR